MINREIYGNKTKEEYKKSSDKIWDKRYNSPYLIRKHLHRTQYYTILDNLNQMSSKPQKILDYGCGEGVLSVLLANKGYNVVGLDISVPNIEVARRIASENNLKIDFITGDGENLPFEDKSFDLVVASHSVEHLPNLEKGLGEIKRIADKAVIAVPTCMGLSSLALLGGDAPWLISRKTPYALLYGFSRFITNLNEKGVLENYAGKEEFPHPWFYPWKFRKILEENGFKISKIEAGSLIFPYISFLFPETIHFFKFIDKFRDKRIFYYFGYGTTYFLEVKK